jgi:hypothetical protein
MRAGAPVVRWRPCGNCADSISWNCARQPALAPDNLRETAIAKQAKTLDDLFHDTLKDIY